MKSLKIFTTWFLESLTHFQVLFYLQLVFIIASGFHVVIKVSSYRIATETFLFWKFVSNSSCSTSFIYMKTVVFLAWQLPVTLHVENTVDVIFRFVSCMLQGTSFLCSTMLFWFTVDWRLLCHFIRPKTWIKKEIVCCFDNLKLNWEKNIQNHLGDATDMCCGHSCLGHMHMLKCPFQSDWVNRTSILLLYYTHSGLISVYV